MVGGIEALGLQLSALEIVFTSGSGVVWHGMKGSGTHVSALFHFSWALRECSPCFRRAKSIIRLRFSLKLLDHLDLEFEFCHILPKIGNIIE